MYKMNRAHIYFIILIALFIHLTILCHFKIFGVKPDLMLILVIFFGLFLGSSAGLETGLAAGFLKDLFALDIFWANALVFGVTGLLAGILSEKFYKESKATQCFLVLSLTAFAMSVHYLISSAFLKSVNWPFGNYFFFYAVPTGCYTAALAIPIFARLIDNYNLRDYRNIL